MKHYFDEFVEEIVQLGPGACQQAVRSGMLLAEQVIAGRCLDMVEAMGQEDFSPEDLRWLCPTGPDGDSEGLIL